jgi:hypothetical protein
VDPRAGLGDVEKRKFLTLPRHELRPLGYPAHRQSLYRLSYPASYKTKNYGAAAFGSITFILNFMKIGENVQKLKG